ncbi:MAG TPA: HAD-IIB family hydrolase [Candidatus Paceibacterota bacterium]|nr:HAD-IIB family hydrolase [Candidatus Paceibacterota bacterium]
MPKHVFFDLDNTLTKSRRPIDAVHTALFADLCAKVDVIVVTGGTKVHIEEQLGPAKGNYFILATSGNHCLHKNGEELWNEPLSKAQKQACLDFIALLQAHFNVVVKDENDCIDDRSAQIGYSVIGYHEDPAKKDAFDPDFSRRKAALARFEDEMKKLNAAGIEVFPAGSSGFNFTPIGKDKGANVARLIEHEAWKKEERLYVGDALGPGENDFSVVGIIATHAVKNPDETFAFIAKSLLS